MTVHFFCKWSMPVTVLNEFGSGCKTIFYDGRRDSHLALLFVWMKFCVHELHDACKTKLHVLNAPCVGDMCFAPLAVECGWKPTSQNWHRRQTKIVNCAKSYMLFEYLQSWNCKLWNDLKVNVMLERGLPKDHLEQSSLHQREQCFHVKDHHNHDEWRLSS